MAYVIGAVGGGESNGFIDVAVLPPIAEARPNTTYLRTTDLTLHYTLFEITTPAVLSTWGVTNLVASDFESQHANLNVIYHGAVTSHPSPPPSGSVALFFDIHEFRFRVRYPDGIIGLVSATDVLRPPSLSAVTWIGRLGIPGVNVAIAPNSRHINTERELRAYLDETPAIVTDINTNTTDYYIGWFGGTEVYRITNVVIGTPPIFNFQYELLGILALGPVTNSFTGTTQALAEAARDTYAAANATWLAFYDANRNRFIELSYGTTRAFQARNVGGAGWDNITGFARGAQGPPGQFTGVSLVGTDLVFAQSAGTSIMVDVSSLIDGLGNGTVYRLSQSSQSGNVFVFTPPADFEPLVNGDIVELVTQVVASASGTAQIEISGTQYGFLDAGTSTIAADDIVGDTTYLGVFDGGQIHRIGPIPHLTVAQVTNLIATWARASGATGQVPDALIPSDIARDTEVQTAIAPFLNQSAITALIATWALSTNPTGLIPDALLSADITRDTELAAAIAAFLDQAAVDTRIALALADAVTGNTETDITVTYASGKLNFDVTSAGLTGITYDTASRIATFSLANGSSVTLNLSTLAPLASPALTGTPTAPTATTGDSSTSLATTAFVGSAVQASLVAAMQGHLVSAVLQTNNILDLTLTDGTVVNADLTALRVGVVDSIIANNGLEADQPHGDVTVGISAGGIAYDRLSAAAIAGILASPALTGVPTAPTPSGGSNDHTIATTRFVENVAAGFVTAVLTASDSGLSGGSTTGDVNLILSTGGIQYLNFSAQAILDLYANPVFTGVPSAPTAPSGTNSLQIANTAFVEEATQSLPTENAVEHLIQNAIRDAVTGNVETGLSVTYQTGGTLDFVLDAAGVRTALGLTSQEAIDLVVGLTLAGSTLTVHYNGRADQNITLPAGGGGGGTDGVLQSAALDSTTGLATFTLTTSGTVTLDLSPLLGTNVFTDSSITGTGADSANALSAVGYAGPAITSVAANYVTRQFTFTHINATTTQLAFTDIPSFYGVGGDTFTTGHTFFTGDSAIVGSRLYIYNHATSAVYDPVTILASNRFRIVPVFTTAGVLDTAALAAGGAVGDALSITGAGVMAWEAAVTGILTPNAGGLEGGSTSGEVSLSIADAGIIPVMLSAVAPSTGQVLAYNGTGFVWTAQTGGTTVVANPATASTSDLLRLTVGSATFEVQDEVVDVTLTGLPVLGSTNYQRLFVDHDTPRVWVGHREELGGTPAVATSSDYANVNYHGAHRLAILEPMLIGQFYYRSGTHQWFQTTQIVTLWVWTGASFSVLFPDSLWLGEQPDDGTAAGLIPTPFDLTLSYYYYNTADETVKLIDNTSFVAAVGSQIHYVAEPISAPNTVGTISGLTAGAGLAGGGLSGVVALSLDLSALTVADGEFIEGSDDRLYIENRDETPYQQQISIFELQQALMRSVGTAHQSPADGDRFLVLDVSFEGGSPRYIRWDSLRGIFLTDAALDVADPTTESTVVAASRQAVAEAIAAVPGGGGGAGDITSIITAAQSGLQGGMDSGDVTLSLDIAGLDIFQTNDADVADEVLLWDASDSTNRNKSMTIGRFVGRMAGTTTTIDAADGRLSVAGSGITQVQLAAPFKQVQVGITTTVAYTATGTTGTITAAETGLSSTDRAGDQYSFLLPTNASPAGNATDTVEFVPDATKTAVALVTPDGTNLTRDDLAFGGYYEVIYINSQWVVASGAGSGGGGAGDITAVNTAALSGLCRWSDCRCCVTVNKRCQYNGRNEQRPNGSRRAPGRMESVRHSHVAPLYGCQPHDECR